MTAASDKSDRAVVNGAASVSAVPASVPSADSRLWCLHDIGPDEVHPAPNFETAQKWANWANERFHKHAEFTRFVVALWPLNAERHAETLAKSIEEWTLPEGRDDGGDFLQQLTGRARHLRDRGEIKTPELLDQAHRMLAAIYGWREYDWPEGFCRRTADLIAENAERVAAQGTPTRSAETKGSVGEADGGPVAESDAPEPQSDTPS